MSINLDSVFYLCRAAPFHRRPRKSGVIVNDASIYGMMGVPNAHTYTATKGALINYTRSLATARCWWPTAAACRSSRACQAAPIRAASPGA
ncbi:MAG: SDR family oxidoreductase [Panacagrimonas sp.]